MIKVVSGYSPSILIVNVIFDRSVLPPSDRASRCLLVCFGSIALGVLVTARCLEPSTDGFGTHQALGLPACGFRVVYGKPCPSCGMTTSWALLSRGRISEAILANAGGFLLGVAAFVSGVWMLGSGIRGVWLIGFPSVAVIVTSSVGILLVIIANWLYQLFA